MTADGEPRDRFIVPAKAAAGAVNPTLAADGAVLCLFDGSAAAVPRLRFAAEAALAAGRRLVVAHVEKPSTGFWAAAFTGYGVCLGPPERLFSSSSEAAFATAVEGLLDVPAGWDFAASRSGRFRALRDLTTAHQVAVVVLHGRRRLARRMARNRALTILSP